MQYFEIPLRTDLPSYSQKVTLEDVLYTLSLRYNSRMTNWIISIGDASGLDLLTGIPLVQGMPLTYRFVGRKAIFPPGQFLVIDETEQGRDPGRDNLGADIKLIYVSEV